MDNLEIRVDVNRICDEEVMSLIQLVSFSNELIGYCEETEKLQLMIDFEIMARSLHMRDEDRFMTPPEIFVLFITMPFEEFKALYDEIEAEIRKEIDPQLENMNENRRLEPFEKFLSTLE